MSNGDPPPTSTAPYIIICSRRTQVSLAKNADEIVVAASLAAAETCSFMEIKFKATAEDMADISRLQHYLMDHGAELTKQQASEKASEMFDLLTVLEHKYSGDHDY